MALLEIANPENITTVAIRKRAEASSRSLHTKQYVVVENGLEVGFLSLDIRPKVDYLVLYELFVPEEYRCRGVASRTLIETEKFAKSLEYKKVTLNPSSLENEYPKSKLINWYKKRGYIERQECPSELEKCIT